MHPQIALTLLVCLKSFIKSIFVVGNIIIDLNILEKEVNRECHSRWAWKKKCIQFIFSIFL